MNSKGRQHDKIQDFNVTAVCLKVSKYNQSREAPLLLQLPSCRNTTVTDEHVIPTKVHYSKICTQTCTVIIGYVGKYLLFGHQHHMPSPRHHESHLKDNSFNVFSLHALSLCKVSTHLHLTFLSMSFCYKCQLALKLYWTIIPSIC